MSSGLLALLDDIAALAKLAATTLDDAAAGATKAGVKAAGVVIDDAAVTPRYVVGMSASREVPMVAKIAVGSLRNKMFFLLPGALLLNALMPFLVAPLLMIGGLFLCLEGFHKVQDLIDPAHAHIDEIFEDGPPQTTVEIEDDRVASAIRTDFVLSAEIMVIALGTVNHIPFIEQVFVLIVVGLAMTVLVYGAVALIVKADDFGAYLARKKNGLVSDFGRWLVLAMPSFLSGLSFIGMLAMLWVGGGIVIHAAHDIGFHWPNVQLLAIEHAIAGLLPRALNILTPVVSWFSGAFISAILGIILGAIAAPLVHYILAPMFDYCCATFNRLSGAKAAK